MTRPPTRRPRAALTEEAAPVVEAEGEEAALATPLVADCVPEEVLEKLNFEEDEELPERAVLETETLAEEDDSVAAALVVDPAAAAEPEEEELHEASDPAWTVTWSE